MSRAGRALRRLVDWAVSAAVLGLALPAAAACALAVLLEDGRPVLFCQERVGLGGRHFRLRKFRTMRQHVETVSELGEIRRGNPLVTRSGAFMRRTKLDEVPQLLSVLAGDMSLVGPRPTIPEQVEEYTQLQRRRLDVRPGLTGWAQVNGNTLLTWDDRILLDLWYVAHRDVLLDMRILCRTVLVLLRGDRVSERALEEARRECESGSWERSTAL